METAGSLSLTIPGEYDVTKLIGFAADANGEDFHLFPMAAESYDGTTYVYFSPTHFSLYGVAQATLQEIQAQTAHPPVKPASQDEEDLAPLLPLIDPTIENVTPLRSVQPACQTGFGPPSGHPVQQGGECGVEFQRLEGQGRHGQRIRFLRAEN
jgi:hypothetical protein